MATTELYPLFSTPVLSIDSDKSKFVDLVEFCETNLEFRANQGGNSTSINTNLLDLPEFREVNQMVSDAVNFYASDIMKWDTSALTFYVTQSWANKNPAGTEHHHHFHTNALFSGVFYLQTVTNDHISFYDDRKPFFKLYETEHTIWNSDKWEIPVVDNRIVIFPAGVLHSVQKHNSSYNRISIAFNVFVKGTIGIKEHLTYLEI
jgi:uncharacterized protein (TIGR02466 family)